MGERRLGQDVVGEPVGESRERMGGERRDDEHVGVLEVRVRVGAGSRAREREEGLGGDEPFGATRHERVDVVPRLDEQPDELARLVGGDAARDADEDPGHADIVPVGCASRESACADSRRAESP